MVAKARSRRKVERPNRYDQLIFFLLCAIVFVVPLTIFPFTADIFELPKVTLIRLFVLVLFSVWALKVYQTGKIEFRRSLLDLPVVFLGAIAVLASLFSINSYLSLLGSYYRYEGIFTLLAYSFFFFAATQVLRDSGRLRTVLYVFAVSVSVNALYGIFQHFGYDFIRLTGKVFELSRSSGALGNPVFLGALLVTGIPISLAGALKEKKASVKFAFLIMFLLQATALFYTGTRAAWLGFGALLLVLALALPQRSTFREVKIAGVALILALLALFVLSRVYVPPGQGITERVFSIFQPRGSAATRLDMWRGSLKLIRDRPLMGSGWETFEGTFPQYSTKFLMSQEELPDRPHNQFLYVGTSAGLLGILAYLWLLLGAYGLAFKRLLDPRLSAERKVLLGVLLAGITGYYVQEQFSISSAGVTPVFWLFLGAAASQSAEADTLASKPLGSIGRGMLVFTAGTVLLVGSIVNLQFFSADVLYRRGIVAPSEVEQGPFFQRAVELNPYLSKYRSALARVYTEEAFGTQNPQRLDEAILVYEEGLRIDPRDEGMWIQLGDLYSARRDSLGMEKAQDAYQRVLDLHPLSAGARWALGDLYLSQGQYQTAITNLEVALSLVPTHTGVLTSLATAYEKAGKTGQARKTYLKIQELDPQNKKAKQALEALAGKK